ncbi:DUF624 domain-containing protein [Actinomyces slackii]|uniref:Predicted integral membrane protein n=1 Tax=Actinomyces slackii TaxID=52774 RepID=A0A448K9K6_9ACTO|nr:DUF624 domain-containing protein [Actinomyces slackii]VEG73550.1 Predicted integral membrane protein [Actinomyces slackii]
MTAWLRHDSPAMRAWSAAADLVVINLLTLLACLPLITAGAALTACMRVMMEMAREEETYTVRSWWRSLRSNLRQSLAWWPPVLVLAALALWEQAVISRAGALEAGIVSGLLAAGVLMVLALLVWLVPLIAFFETGIGRHLVNAARLALGALGRTTACLAVLAAPLAVAWAAPAMRAPTAWFMVLIGVAFQAYLVALIQRGIINRLRQRA